MTTIRVDGTSAECVVLTFKEGALSRVAHDLRLRASSLWIEIDPATLAVRAAVDARSLRVEGAMVDGALAPSVLGASDRARIERSIAEEVLASAAHPEIRFTSSSVVELRRARYRVEGVLELRGARREVGFEVVEQDGALVAELRLHQPDFGVRPFTALLGALRVRAEVVVRVTARGVPQPIA